VRTAPRGSAGFNIFMPVFGRRSEQLVLKGFVFSSFRANDFLASATPLYADPSLEVSLYDGAVMPDRLMAQGPMRGKVGSMVERKVTIGNRNWILTVGRTRSGTLSDLSRVGLLFGIVTSLLVLAVARLITRRAEEDRLVVEWLTRQSGIRNSLTRELNHRVKNTLANVLSIVSLTRRRATDLDDFADSLTGRLRALSATHDLLSQTDWREVSIHDLIRAELAPYLETLDNRITVRGPDISLAPNEALSFGLAIHELMTNAAKYGSLTNEAGTITIEWHLKSPDVAEVLWREEGGPEVQPPSRRGFGIELLEKIVARELDTNFDIQFLPGGVQCRLHLPVRKLSDFNLRTKYAS
jgi:two-component sensor histidine kinase